MKKDSKSYTLYYSGLLKQCRKGKVNPILQLYLYTPDGDICVYRTLTEYIKRTSSLRGDGMNLIISYVKPYKHVVSTTISRWIRCVMENAGIDINKFKSHSTRSATCSKVKQTGLPVTEIMKKAGWSSTNTFAKYYDKPLESRNEDNFQQAALQ